MSEVEKLEQQREDAKNLIQLRDNILKLYKNTTFRKVILDQYCVKECARYIGVAGDPALDKDNRDLALQMGMASQHLLRWLEVTIQMGNSAENELANIDQAILESIHEENEVEVEGEEE